MMITNAVVSFASTLLLAFLWLVGITMTHAYTLLAACRRLDAADITRAYVRLSDLQWASDRIATSTELSRRRTNDLIKAARFVANEESSRPRNDEPWNVHSILGLLNKRRPRVLEETRTVVRYACELLLSPLFAWNA